MIVTRFAPSPTGLLHLGHAFAAITAHEAARAGRFLLRIEDLDSTRSRPEFVVAILEDLHWLGLSWEEPVVRQSERLPVYRAAIDRLAAENLLYPCFCTRAEIAAEIAHAAEAPQGPDGPLYPGTCRSLSVSRREELRRRGVPYALRLDSRAAAARISALTFEEIAIGDDKEKEIIPVNPLQFGDVVLARKETPASYHLAVVVDDAEQGVTLVTRGRDLFAATHVQRVLQALLGFSAPQYCHHRLILDANGRKFSKRNAAISLRSLRQQGVIASEIRRQLFGECE